MKVYQPVKGMRDFLPEDLAKRRFVEGRVRECFELYGYEEIETPVLESYDLLSVKAGEEIRHRMYSFSDLSGRNLALRPEITPSIARIVADKLRSTIKPLRLGYIANCFRYDNPQRGRYREFWQAGFELFGSSQPEADAEIISINDDLMKKVGFSTFLIKIGHVGILHELLSNESVDEAYQNAIMGLMDKRKQKDVFDLLKKLKVSRKCVIAFKNLWKARGTDWEKIVLKGKKILRQNEGALLALQNLEEILFLIRASGAGTELLLDLSFARGLEYYTGMIFEVFVPDIRIALGGGGRYDKLVTLFGGEPTPAVGCAPGIDRMVLALQYKKLFPQNLMEKKKTFVVPVNKEVLPQALKIASDLRRHGIRAHNEISGRNVGSALSYAAKKGFTYAVIIGAKELKRRHVVLRNLRTKTQSEIHIDDLRDKIKTTY